MEKLLRRPTLNEDESLLSYLIRTSMDNAVELDWILKKAELSLGKNNDCINILNDDLIIKRIANLVGMDLEKIKNLTVCNFPYSRKYSTGIESRRNLYLYHDYIDIDHVKYCPRCLKDGHYHRKYWYVTPLMICAKHKSLLLDKCYKCGSKLSIKNIVYGICDCNAELEKAPLTLSRNRIVNEIQKKVVELLNVQKQLEVDLMIDMINPFNNLLALIKRNMGDLHSLKSFYQNGLIDSEEINYLYLLSKVLLEQMGLFLLLDDLHNLPNRGLIGIIERPYNIGIVPKVFTLELSFYNEGFGNNIFEYVKRKYCYAYFEKKLADLIFRDNYMNPSDANSIFNLDYSTLYNKFNNIYVNDKVYINIYEVIDFIRIYINKCHIADWDSTQYTTIQLIFRDFKAFGFSELELLEILKNSEIKCVLSPYDGIGEPVKNFV